MNIPSARDMLEKYPNRLPLFLIGDSKSKLKLKKNKYSIPNDMTFTQFIFVLRRNLRLREDQSLFLFVIGSDQIDILPCTSSLISDYYTEYKDPSGFLVIKYCEENTFGN